MNKKIEKYIDCLIDRKLDDKLKSINNLQKADIVLILKNFTKYKKKLEFLNDELKGLENGSMDLIKNKNNDIKVQHSMQFKDDLEIIEDRIESIKSKIKGYSYLISKIEQVLLMLESSEYHKIIHYRYIEKYSMYDILDIMHISESTYKRHHSKLLSEIKSLLIL